MADSEERQKFEAWWKSERDADIVAGPHLKLCCLNAWRAAYEAGEIAMKEKAAKRVEGNSCAQTCKYCQSDPCGTASADAIRALPLSGAEEATEKTTGG